MSKSSVLFGLARKAKQLHDAMKHCRALVGDDAGAFEKAPGPDLPEALREGWTSLAADAGICAVEERVEAGTPDLEAEASTPDAMPPDGVYRLAGGGCTVVISFSREEHAVAYGRAFGENIDEERQKSLYAHFREWLQSWIADGSPATCDPHHPADVQAEIAALRRRYPLKGEKQREATTDHDQLTPHAEGR